ncbi:hypothetical protein HYALB_00008747 [Hymenoscyphus albidus]|uniref:Uncharacterized protein n=1 Tax=Hymenoscyphus albidus TaxID=595503 RepID=A0A9N9LLV4_9HELO|nr:hypothetical protein HYALB_00008747 [Hymenoscyphus albidus]
MPGTGPTLHCCIGKPRRAGLGNEVKLSWVLSTNEILGLSGQGASGADEESGINGEDDGIIGICKQPPALAVHLDFGRKENMEIGRLMLIKQRQELAGSASADCSLVPTSRGVNREQNWLPLMEASKLRNEVPSAFSASFALFPFQTFDRTTP